jgi:hypothetical protein
MDNEGSRVSMNSVTVREQIYTTSGPQIVGGGVWGVGGNGLDLDGPFKFVDIIGKQNPRSADSVIYQTFTVTVYGSADEWFAPGIAQPTMVQYPGYSDRNGNDTYGVWGHWIQTGNVQTNGLSHHPLAGRTACK